MFFIFPGGGEAARARALLITMTHFALAVWGVLMWHSITEECSMFISEHFKTLRTFHDMSVVHNAGLCALMFCHETGAGKRAGGDFTLMPNIHIPEEPKRPEERERLNAGAATAIDEFGFSGAGVAPLAHEAAPSGLYHAPPSLTCANAIPSI